MFPIITSSARYCLLPSAAVIRVTGPDAADFLRRQLTQNPPPAGGTRFALAAWSDPRGRVRALFRVLRAGDDQLLLIGERETAERVLSKLGLFVLRARIELALDGGRAAAALIGRDVGAWLASHAVPLGAAAGDAARSGALTWLRIGPELVQGVGPSAALEQLGAGLAKASPDEVELAEIRLGLPRVGAAAMERYLPQMLNLERLDAVSFDKGCYPGQEVVARLRYRGAVKRRMRRFVAERAPAPPAPGDGIARADGELVGEVIRAAGAGGALELLAVVTEDASGSTLTLAADPAVRLEPAPLPYE